MKLFLNESPKIFWSLALVIGLSAVSLRVLGALPDYIQPSPPETIEFNSVEAAQEKAGFEIAIPAYFPNRYKWPPERITVNAKPAPMAQMVFVSSSRDEPLLSILQIRTDADDLPVPLPWVSGVKQRVPVDINGNIGTLAVGRNSDGETVNAVYWRANGFYFVTVSLGAVNELLTISRSIHP